MSDALTRWTAPPDLALRLATLFERIHDRIPPRVAPRDVHSLALHAKGAPPMLILSAASCTPHIDATLPPWSILAVLSAAPGHVLGAQDDPPRDGDGDERGDRPKTSCDLRPGDLVRLNIHHLHWLTEAEDGAIFSALALDHEEPPERAAAEASLRRLLDRHGF